MTTVASATGAPAMPPGPVINGPLVSGIDSSTSATVTVVGCGALGSASVNLLARGGVGEIRIIDRDVVELSNLQRQALFEAEEHGE